VPLDGAEALVGSSGDCSLVLTDPSVSPWHARLQLVDGHVRVRDLASQHGTFYLGARISDVLVPPGTVLQLGSTRVSLLPTLPGVDVPGPREELAGMLGRSPAMQRLFARLERVAPTRATVLIQGETGTGKDCVAQALHRLSTRARGPFSVFDCGAVSHELMRSALFGHVRGAFTGAIRDAPGALERAHGGTLFLDEIGELPLELQPALLRALDTQSFSRVGEDQLRGADFRVIAATHKNIEARVREGRFREDLYYRLSAITLVVPPLRERLEDVPVLAEAFARGLTRKRAPLSASTLACLCAYRWSGNVRELRNAVDRVLALGPGTLPGSPSPEEPPDFHRAREQAIQCFERRYLEALLQRHDSAADAMAEAGITRSYFYKLLETHGLRFPRRKARTGRPEGG
jgi:DNA-binding NtrC family response regulator